MISSVPFWQAILLPALACGMGWGIRGQYGHETGAMIAGVLLSLTLARLYLQNCTTLATARAVALGTVAIGLGGSMTYGQTIGLTQNANVVGNWEAWRWGMLGLGIKGAIWFGFAGAFLGMGFSRQSYTTRQILALMAVLLLLFVAGIFCLNMPFNPSKRLLPAIYFSESWHWNPTGNLKPRREVWGGLLFAFVGLQVFLRYIRLDTVGCRLGLWAFLGGFIGFPAGQCLQSYHAWNVTAFQSGIWAKLDPSINWWNMMETTFGTIAGAVVGLGCWLNRQRIVSTGGLLGAPVPSESASRLSGEGVLPGEEESRSCLTGRAEALLLGLHLVLLISTEFLQIRGLTEIYEYGIVMAVIPLVGILGGRYWPYVVILPVTLLPIAGKTAQSLAYDRPRISKPVAWLVYIIIPMLAATALAWRESRRSGAAGSSTMLTRNGLLFCVWIYYGLNFAFFDFPWPWQPWTTRTPNAIIYTACAVTLTVFALRSARHTPASAAAAA